MRENGRPQQYPQPARPKSAPPINNGEEAEPQRPKPVTISSHHQQKDDRKRVHKKSLSSNEPVSITLQKGDKGFGFSIRGGNGEPLAVLRIAENGAAAIDGRIKVSSCVFSSLFEALCRLCQKDGSISVNFNFNFNFNAS